MDNNQLNSVQNSQQTGNGQLNPQVTPLPTMPVQNVAQVNNIQPVAPQPVEPQVVPIPSISTETLQQQNENIQQQLNSIPTVDQGSEQFINNTQAANIVKKEEKKESPNIIFIILLFALILAAIIFLFPYLQSKNL